MNIVSVEWRRKSSRKEGGWEVAFPGAEGFEGPSCRPWVCEWGQGWVRGGMGPSVPQVRHLTFKSLWASNCNEAWGRAGRSLESFVGFSRQGAALCHPSVPRALACGAGAPSWLVQNSPGTDGFLWL